jgi:hypothetical protein
MEPTSGSLTSFGRDDRLSTRAIDRELRRRLQNFSPFARSGLLYVLQEPEPARSAAIGKLWSDPATRPLAELLIDLEEDRTASRVALAILRNDAE